MAQINPMYRGTYVEEGIREGRSKIVQSKINNAISQGLSIVSALPMFNSNTSVIGIPGNKANLTQFPNIVVSVQRYGGKDIPTDVAGRPLYENKQIKTLSGYVKCQNASINISGLAGDKEEVNAYLNNGFYYE